MNKQEIQEYIQQEIQKYFKQNIQSEIEKYNNRYQENCEYCKNTHNKYDYCITKDKYKQVEIQEEYEQALNDGYSFFGVS
jgi:hypothetical protein